MKKLSTLLLIFATLLIAFSSCTKSVDKPEAKFKGTWVLDSFEPVYSHSHIKDSVRYYLALSISENKQEFATNVLPAEDLIKGEWLLKGDTLELVYSVPNYEFTIDSTLLLNDSAGNSSMDFYSGELKVGTLNKDGVAMIKYHHLGKMNSSNGTSFSVYLEDVGTMNFSREIIEEGKFSIVSVLRGILGLAFLLGIAWLFSSNRKAIDWSLVGKGIALQIVIALLVLKAPYVDVVFMWISAKFVELIGFTNSGVDFLFGQMGIGEVQAPLITFAIKVLPTIIFFSALMSLLYYWGMLQKVVFAFAWLMKRFMRLSGAESLAAAGNVFLGQTESPLLVKPYLLGMTKSEIMCLMTGGMATIAGGVLAAYIGFLGGDDPEAQAFFAKHLLTASIISAPAAIVAAKILMPETEKINEDLKISKDKIGVNALEAISNGTTDGLKLAVNVGAMLLVFIAMMALANGILYKVGYLGNLNDIIKENTNYDGLSFQFLLGYACAPIVWIMGVDSPDIVYVGELLGQKTILNEFVAYPRLGELKNAGLLNEKSVIMSTYMLCGFANIASIGIQIGGIGALIPTRKGLLSQLGVKALIGGTIACLLTAVVVGMTM